MIVMSQAHMSSLESGLSNAHDPMAVVSDDEVMPAPEIYTSDIESDPVMLSKDEDDFQPFALPDFGDDLPIADGFPDEDPFDIPAPVYDHLIIGHPDGEHIVAPFLDPVPLVVIPPDDWPSDDLFDDDVDLFVDGPPANAQGDREIDEDVVAVPPPAVPFIELSSNSGLHSVSDSFESVTSSALRAAGLQLLLPILMTTLLCLLHHLLLPDVAPIDPEPIPDPDHVPFGVLDIAPLIPDPVPAPVDLPFAEPFIPPPAPADVAPLPPVESDVHRTDLPIVFLQDIPAPRPREGTLGQPKSYDPFASAAFPLIP
ncbi:hypothetical protein Hanom_Chr07g00624621 [Helianthus anomalus]